MHLPKKEQTTSVLNCYLCNLKCYKQYLYFGQSQLYIKNTLSFFLYFRQTSLYVLSWDHMLQQQPYQCILVLHYIILSLSQSGEQLCQIIIEVYLLHLLEWQVICRLPQSFIKSLLLCRFFVNLTSFQFLLSTCIHVCSRLKSWNQGCRLD